VLAGGKVAFNALVTKLDVDGWLERPAMKLDEERALLVVGTMSSGTKECAFQLQGLGLEMLHENSDTTGYKCRDGTVSWAHGLRFLEPSKNTVDRLCSQARLGSFSSAMFDPSPGCARVIGVWWDKCWENECKRVAAKELGCGLAASRDSCNSPFRSTLLQVRNPLHMVASAVAAFCNGTDTVHAATRSLQLDTINALFAIPPRPANRERECSRQFGWYWVMYNRAMLDAGLPWFRVEDTPYCEILRLAGLVSGPNSDLVETGPSTAMPDSVLRGLQSRCSSADAFSKTSIQKAHGSINRRNVGKRRIQLSFVDIQGIDQQLAKEMQALALKLGYGEL